MSNELDTTTNTPPSPKQNMNESLMQSFHMTTVKIARVATRDGHSLTGHLVGTVLHGREFTRYGQLFTDVHWAAMMVRLWSSDEPQSECY